MPKKYWIALFLLLLAAVATGFWIIQSQASFPSNIKSQAHFPIYFPAPSSGVDPSSIKITTRGSDKVLTFVLKKGSNQVTFTEQAAPSILTDQTAVDKLAGLMHVYKELNTSIGKVELTRPQELKGTQTARIAVSGRGIGPSLYHMLEVMGKERVLARFERMISQLGAK